MYDVRIVHSRKLMIDDRFKMAGSMYRITDVAPSVLSEVVIWAYNIENPSETIMLNVGALAHFKIYNLK